VSELVEVRNDFVRVRVGDPRVAVGAAAADVAHGVPVALASAAGLVENDDRVLVAALGGDTLQSFPRGAGESVVLRRATRQAQVICLGTGTGRTLDELRGTFLRDVGVEYVGTVSGEGNLVVRAGFPHLLLVRKEHVGYVALQGVARRVAHPDDVPVRVGESDDERRGGSGSRLARFSQATAVLVGSADVSPALGGDVFLPLRHLDRSRVRRRRHAGYRHEVPRRREEVVAGTAYQLELVVRVVRVGAHEPFLGRLEEVIDPRRGDLAPDVVPGLAGTAEGRVLFLWILRLVRRRRRK